MCGSVENLCDLNLLNHRAVVKGGVKEQQCRHMLDDFFLKMRGKQNYM
jgi:tRNA(adenine34) deaminase